MSVPITPTELSPRQTYRGFIVKGFEPEEAARLTASVYGLPLFDEDKPIRWKIKEICDLLFLAHRAGKGDDL
jgi:hypothetical protein